MGPALLTELRAASRRLRADPWFTGGAALLLAVGIGSSTALVSVARTVLLDPLPFAEPSGLMRLVTVRPGATHRTWSEAEYLTVEARARGQQELVAYDDELSLGLVLSDGAVQVDAAAATPNLLAALGVAPVEGRFFMAAEALPGSAKVVALTETFWRSAFAGSPAVVGQTVDVGGERHSVVGVVPASLETLFPGAVLWTPLRLDRSAPNVNSGQYIRVIGRLSPGVGPEAFQRELDRVAAQLTAESLTRYSGTRIAAAPLADDLVADVRTEMTTLSVLVLMGLLTICFNLAGFLLARGVRQRSELALRAALGAGPRRLLAATLSEALILATAGVLAGVALGFVAIAALANADPAWLPRANELTPDASVLGTTAALGALTVLLFGLLPSLSVLRLSSPAALVSAARAGTGRSRHRVRRMLVATQLAVSAALVVAAGGLLRTLVELDRVELGFDVPERLTFEVDLPAARYATPSDVRGFLDALLDDVRALPGVAAAAASNRLPLKAGRSSGFAWTSATSREGVLPAALEMRWASPGYFGALGVDMISGRTFRRGDAIEAETPTVLSRSLADALWPGQDPLGRRWKLGRLVDGSTPWRRVVGVVEDVRLSGPRGALQPVAYFPHTRLGAGREIQVVVRSSRPGASLIPDIRRAVEALDPAQPVHGFIDMDGLARQATTLNRVAASLVAGLAALVVLLSAIGLHGLIGFSVAERTRELAVRSALGATNGRLVRLLLGEGAALAGFAVVPGLAAGVLASRAFSGLLQGVPVLDPLTLTASATMVLGLGLTASWLPTRRALSDVGAALRR